MRVSGMRIVALGVGTKIITNGKCNHPDKRRVNEEYLRDRLPITEFAWTHCIFCRNDGCIFVGECKHRIE